MHETDGTDVRHPNFAWARAKIYQAKGMGVHGATEEEFDTLFWDSFDDCYKFEWRGMMLALEVDGQIHS